MHYFTYFNRTDAESHGYWKACKVLLITEIALLLMSHIYYIMTTYMMIKGMRYQKNLRILWALCSIQYLLSTMDRIVQIIITIFTIEGSRPSSAFMYTSYMRAFCIHIAFYSLPVSVAERCFATYFLEDYEKKQRAYLGYALAFLLLAMAASSSYIYHAGNSTTGLFVIVMLLNNIGILANIFNYKLNKRYYMETMSQKRGLRAYSLGERYQVAENIRACRFFNSTVLWVGFLNMIASVSLIVDNFVTSIFYANVAVLTFNYSIVVYGLVIPVVIYLHNESWQIELKRLKHKVMMKVTPLSDSENKQNLLKSCEALSRGKTLPFFVSVKSTLGKETHVEQEKHADIHFTMLQRDWK